MSRPQVSAFIVNWNGRRYLDACIASLRAQTHPLTEIILVDNASEDDSVGWVETHHPDVRVVARDVNDGPGGARNAGLEAAGTRWVLAVDNDVILSEDALEKLLRHAREDVVIVHPRAVFDHDRARIHYDGGDLHYVGMMTLHHFFAPAEDADTDVVDIDAAISMALLMDREKTLAAGGYDPRHFILFEDHDLSYRLRSRGHRIVRDPAAIVYHREGTEGLSFRDGDDYAHNRVRLHSRNRWIVILKCHGWRAILLGLPGLFAYEAAYLFFAIRNRSLGAWMKGKTELVKMLPSLLRERRSIQRSRSVADRRLLKSRPLTISPLIRRRGIVAWGERCLDGFLRAWWRVVGWMT